MREISLYRSDCDLLARLQNLEERRWEDSQVSWKKQSIKCLSLSGWEMYHEQMCDQCSCQSGVHHLVGLVNHLGQHLGATCFEWSLDPSHSYYTGSHTLHTTIGHQFNTVCDSSHSYIWCIYTSIQISRISVTQGTIESDNKRRPVILKRNASKYQPPSPEPPDPNSGKCQH